MSSFYCPIAVVTFASKCCFLFSFFSGCFFLFHFRSLHSNLSAEIVLLKTEELLIYEWLMIISIYGTFRYIISLYGYDFFFFSDGFNFHSFTMIVKVGKNRWNCTHSGTVRVGIKWKWKGTSRSIFVQCVVHY